MWLSKRNSLALALLASAAPAPAHPWTQGSPGNLVSVEVLVEGRPVPLYPAPDGSGRSYLEAREGARYSIRIQNRTSRRLAVSLRVDGLDAISGERREGLLLQPPNGDRLYVLDPWGVSEVRGWRTSLRDVQRFVFVDERASYAARKGQTSARMGWIELSVYRERYAHWRDSVPAPSAKLPRAPAGSAREPLDADPEAPALGSSAPSYPGTGWGPRAFDPVEVVAFEPEPHSLERVTLRYEYRQALVALGIDLGKEQARDRLWQRDRGEGGFARPPRW